MASHPVSSTSVRSAAPASLGVAGARAAGPSLRSAGRPAAGPAASLAAARLAFSPGALPRRPRRSELSSRTLVGVSSRELGELRESLAPLRSPDAAADPDRLCRTLFVAETSLPTTHGTFRVRAYRHTNDGGRTWTEPVAIISGRPEHRSRVSVRVHDACFTSEVLGSCKCDCKAQLDRALEAISRSPPGIVLYLHQEGRGIGLANKLAAYALQERGLDTVDANRALGLPDDCREYSAAKGMLDDMDVRSVALMTNNPRKLRQVAAAGVAVDGRLACVAKAHPIAYGYLRTKAARMGHQLGSDAGWMQDGEGERGEGEGVEADAERPAEVGAAETPIAHLVTPSLSHQRRLDLQRAHGHHAHGPNCGCKGRAAAPPAARGGALGALADAPASARRAGAQVAPLPADMP